MRPVVKNYMGMIVIAVAAVLVVGAVSVRIDREQVAHVPDGVEATPAISGNAPQGLVDAQWLSKYSSQVDYIFDLSDQRQYEAGHIPGAIHVWWQDGMAIHSQNYAEPSQISASPDPDAIFGRLNLDVPQTARIVLYDSQQSERASWMMWLMSINGYTDVHVLDGGLPAWIGADGELAAESEDPRNENVTATPTWDEEFLIRREALRDRLDEENLVIVDTRSAGERLDDVNSTIRQGIIPGSINIPTAEVMRDDGTFRSPSELRALFESYGLYPENEIVVYSLFTTHSGNVWLALQIAGYDQVMIYQEGFVGWGRDEEMPIDPVPRPLATPFATPDFATPEATPEPDNTDTQQPTPEEDGPTDLTGL